MSRLNDGAGISWEAAANNAVITPDDESRDTPPGDGAPVCPTCNEIIVLEPGHKGRKPKYHPGHRPSDLKAPGATIRGPRKGTRNKAEKEADEIAERLRKNLVLGATFLAMVEPFDAAAVLAGARPLSGSVSDVLTSSERLRGFFVTSKGSAGWAGLAMWTLAIVLPILAHHGLIPGEVKRKGQPPIKIADILERLPRMLASLEKKLETAEADLAEKLTDADAN